MLETLNQLLISIRVVCSVSIHSYKYILNSKLNAEFKLTIGGVSKSMLVNSVNREIENK